MVSPWQPEGSFSEAESDPFLPQFKKQKGLLPRGLPHALCNMLSDPSHPLKHASPPFACPLPICPSRLGLKVPEPPVSTPEPCYPRDWVLAPWQLAPHFTTVLSYRLPPQDNRSQDEDHICLAQCITSQVCPFL